ncbi:MAG: hypothetical protein U0235_10900 [Polyangiaceae bacterium]
MRRLKAQRVEVRWSARSIGERRAAGGAVAHDLESAIEEAARVRARASRERSERPSKLGVRARSA